MLLTGVGWQLRKLVSLLLMISAEWQEKTWETVDFRNSLARHLGVAEVPLSRASGTTLLLRAGTDETAAYHAIHAERVHAHKYLSVTDDVYSQLVLLKDWVVRGSMRCVCSPQLHRKYPTRESGRLGAGLLVERIIEIVVRVWRLCMLLIVAFRVRTPVTN